MALSSLVSSLKTTLNWTAEKTITGSAYTSIQNSTTITKTVSGGTSVANSALGGSDEFISFVQSISASSSATIDLTSLTNILSTTGVSLARVKAIQIRLLSTTDDTSIGTAASSIIVGNNAANDFISQSNTGWLSTAASTFVIANGGFLAFGAGTAGGVLVDSTHKIIKIANNDAAVTAKVEISIIGGST